MVFVSCLERENRTLYTMVLGAEVAQLVISPNNKHLMLNGTKVDEELEELIVEELKGSLTTLEEEQLNMVRDVLNYLENTETTKENFLDYSAIKRVFKEWTGFPTRKQASVMQEFGLEYHPPTNGRHGRIYLTANPKRWIPVSCTPSSRYAGRGVASDLIKLVQSAYTSTAQLVKSINKILFLSHKILDEN